MPNVNLVFIPFLMSLLLFAACASEPALNRGPAPTPPPPLQEPSPSVVAQPLSDAQLDLQEQQSVDLVGLERNLGFSERQTGYREKIFQSCDVGYGFSNSHRCRQLVFAVIDFQLQCRDSNGTVSDVDYKVTPVVSDQIKWNFDTKNGMTSSDSEGMGRVHGFFSKSPRASRFRLTVDGDFLTLSAQDVRKIVAPKEWCDHR